MKQQYLYAITFGTIARFSIQPWASQRHLWGCSLQPSLTQCETQDGQSHFVVWISDCKSSAIRGGENVEQDSIFKLTGSIPTIPNTNLCHGPTCRRADWNFCVKTSWHTGAAMFLQWQFLDIIQWYSMGQDISLGVDFMRIVAFLANRGLNVFVKFTWCCMKLMFIL